MTYFHWKYNQLSSALKRFTVLFGMGRSGLQVSTALRFFLEVLFELRLFKASRL